MPDKHRKPAGKVVDMREYQRRRDQKLRKEGIKPASGPKKPRSARPPLPNAWLYITFAVVLVLAIGVLVTLDVFSLRSIAVEGSYTMAKEEIVQKSGLALGQHMLKVSAGRVRAGVESDALLEYVSLKWDFPDGLILTVNQRQPAAAISFLGSYIVVDEELRVLDVRSEPPAGQYPLLSGINVAEYEVGQVLKTDDTAKETVYRTLAQALAAHSLKDDIAEINLQQTADIMLLTRNGTVIEMGNATALEEKCAWVEATLPQLRSQGKSGGTLFVTGSNGAVYSTAQPTYPTPPPAEEPQQDTPEEEGTPETENDPAEE